MIQFILVVKMKFGHNDTDKFAYATADGYITILNVAKKEVICSLKCPKPVTDFDWFYNNDFILATHQDKVIRLWNIQKQKVAKSMEDKNLPICCLFCPKDKHHCVIGFQNGGIYVFNLTTNKIIQKLDINEDLLSSFTLGSFRYKDTVSITCMTFNKKGDYLFVGDSKGSLILYSMDIHSKVFKRISKTQITKNSTKIVSIDFNSFSVSDIQNTNCLCITGLENLVRVY